MVWGEFLCSLRMTTNLPKMLSNYSPLVFAYLNSLKMERGYNQLPLALAAVMRIRKNITLSQTKVAAVVDPLAKQENLIGMPF